MTPEEIRKLEVYSSRPGKSFSTELTQLLLLREMAAQLAELNLNLKAVLEKANSRSIWEQAFGGKHL